MTVHREDTEQELYEVVKRIRTAVRLEFQIKADQVLNELLPAAEAAWQRSVNHGTAPDTKAFAAKWARKAVE